MSWNETRSYSFDVRDRRFRSVQRLFAKGQPDKALVILGELRREAKATNKTGRTLSRGRGR